MNSKHSSLPVAEALYKGANLATNDKTKEKEKLGKLWGAQSGGQCLFEMVKGLSELPKIQNAIGKATVS